MVKQPLRFNSIVEALRPWTKESLRTDRVMAFFFTGWLPLPCEGDVSRGEASHHNDTVEGATP